MAGFEDFESLGDSKCRCKNCGEVIEAGILNLALHYDHCPEAVVILIGKDFGSKLIKRKEIENENIKQGNNAG